LMFIKRYLLNVVERLLQSKRSPPYFWDDPRGCVRKGRQRFRFTLKDQEEAACRLIPVGVWPCGTTVGSCGRAGNGQSMSHRGGRYLREVNQHFSNRSSISGSVIDFRLRWIDN
jgi:hypothetical protein